MISGLAEIYRAFNPAGALVSAVRFGNGHIHDTFRITTTSVSVPGYILQRINTNVFRNIEGLQGNIEKVTEHICRKLTTIPVSQPDRQCLRLIPTHEGKSWYTHTDGSCWRMYLFIANHSNYEIVDSEGRAFEGGRAIGNFTAMVADMDPAKLEETIPGFHNTPSRIDNFMRSLKNDNAGRAASVVVESEKIIARAGSMKIIVKLGREGKIPLRVTHNDTKFNNILFDENDHALCVIDLDTVMPGYVHYDFGDAIRTAASTAAEDEPDLDRVSINLRFYDAWTGGFLSEAGKYLTRAEKEWLSFAPRLITYEQALRFLNDYINGDIYYRTSFPGHNLQRARTQLRLLESMEENAPEMEMIVKKYI